MLSTELKNTVKNTQEHLNKLNFDFPTEKYKRVERPRRDNFELPKGVRVQSSVFGDE
jgi:hypothetical protein